MYVCTHAFVHVRSLLHLVYFTFFISIKGSRKKGKCKSWTDYEHLVLVHAYDMESRYASKGKDRRGDKLWQAIADRFRVQVHKDFASTGFEYAHWPVDACRRKYKAIMHDVRKNHAYYITVRKAKPTGSTPAVWETTAKEMFRKAMVKLLRLADNGSSNEVTFNYRNVWDEKREDLDQTLELMS